MSSITLSVTDITADDGAVLDDLTFELSTDGQTLDLLSARTDNDFEVNVPVDGAPGPYVLRTFAVSGNFPLNSEVTWSYELTVIPGPSFFVGIDVEGLDVRNIACRNNTIDAEVVSDSPEIGLRTRVNCDDLGLVSRFGDSITVQVQGVKRTQRLAGVAAADLGDSTEQCRNDTTGQTVSGAAGRDVFDCVSRNLDVRDGDIVSVSFRGVSTTERAPLALATLQGVDTRTFGCSNTWDCVEAGLEVREQDKVTVTIAGPVEIP